MASDALTAVTTFINSPPGQLVAGATLAGVVWKVFERVENLLKEEVKSEFGRDLLAVQATPSLQRWNEAFLEFFDRLFPLRASIYGGSDDFDKAIDRSMIYVILVLLLTALISFPFHLHQNPAMVQRFLPAPLFSGSWKDAFSDPWHNEFGFVAAIILVCVAPAVISLIVSRLFLTLMARTADTWCGIGLCICQLAVSYYIGMIGLLLGLKMGHYLFGTPSVTEVLAPGEAALWILPHEMLLRLWKSGAPIWFLVPSLFTSGWLILYLCSGFLVRFAKRFDIGFQWFNRTFDIEKKPLQSIGLVAGVLVALTYWAAVIVSRLT